MNSGSIKGKKNPTHRHRGYKAWRCGRKQAIIWKMILHSVETRRLRLMAEIRPEWTALVLKGCEAVTITLLVKSGDSQLEHWRLQLHVLPTWVVSGSQKAKIYFTSCLIDFTRRSPVVGLVELDQLTQSGEQYLSLQAPIHKKFCLMISRANIRSIFPVFKPLCCIIYKHKALVLNKAVFFRFFPF